MTPAERDLIVECLQYRKNYIETHDITLSAADARERGLHCPPPTDDQRELINTIRSLIKRLRDVDFSKKAKPKPQEPPKRIEAKADWQEAVELSNEIVSMCDEAPPAGVHYAMSVSEKVASIGETIERTKRVSDKQWVALENMRSGLENWIANDWGD